MAAAGFNGGGGYDRRTEEAFDVILEANGFTRDNVHKKMPNIFRLEIYLVHYPQMLAIDRFANLKHLEARVFPR
jgi:hypothetical protein